MTLAGAVTALLDVLADADAVGVADAWRAVGQVAPQDRVREAAAVVGELVPDDSAGEAAMRAALAGRYRVVGPFLVLLSGALPLDAAPAGQKILAAVRTLPGLAARRVRQRPLSRNEIDADLVPPVWGRAVYGNRDLSPGAVDRDACVLCVLEQLRAALRRRDIFAAPSLRWAWPAGDAAARAGLGSGPAGDHRQPRPGRACRGTPAGPGPLAGYRVAGDDAAPRRGGTGELCGLRRSDVHLLADSRPLGCEIARAHLHVVRRRTTPTGPGRSPGGSARCRWTS